MNGNGENETILCRCSDVTLNRIRELIDQGYTSFDELKRITRIGMGPCQGKTCSLLVLRELSIRTGKPMQDLLPQTPRPLAIGVTLEAIAKEGARHEE